MQQIIAKTIWLILVLSCTVLNPSAYAQEGNEEKWFQAELIIFKRQQADAHVATAEQWPATVELAYPENRVWLIDPDATDLLERDTTKPAGQSSMRQQEEPFDGDIVLQDERLQQELNPADTERPFVLLPEKQRSLNDSAAAIQRRADFELLFHEAWRQPVANAEQAASIIIAAGQQFDEHHELEGSIKLSLSRYLHITTHLWLSEFERLTPELMAFPHNAIANDTCHTDMPGRQYSEQSCESSTSYWPSLPRPPVKETLLRTAVADPDDLEAADRAHEKDQRETMNNDQQKPSERFSITLNGREISEIDNSNEVKRREVETETAPSLVNYRVSTIATLNQSRRMRSDELHYIDHPKLGLIIRLSPYDPGRGDATTDNTAP